MSGDYRPSLGDLLDATTKAGAGKARGPVPAEVVSYDRTNQTASVRPLVSPKGGPALPVIPRVPVSFPRGTGASITWDLVAGDEVLLVVCENDCSRWLARGLDGEAPTQRKSDLADAVAIPGLGSLQRVLAATAYAAGALVLTSSDIRLGSSAAAQYVAMANKVLSELQAIKNYLDNHVHLPGTFNNGGGPVVGVSGAPFAACPAPSSVACTKAKVE